MWKKAVNNLVVGNELTVNIPNSHVQLFKTKLASGPKLNQDEFRSFKELLAAYVWEDNPHAPFQRRIRPNANGLLFDLARNNFLKVIIRPGGPIEEAYNYLRRKGLLPTVANLANFEAKLQDIWFRHRGFQHTFVGDKWEYHWIAYSGFHNWFQFRSEQANPPGRIANVNIPPGNFNGNTEPPFMSLLEFNWNGYLKNGGSSMFVGTSPAFEIALYSVCFIEHPGQPCSCHIGRSTITVQTNDAVAVGGTADQISRAYPKDVVIEEKRCDFHPNDRTDCGWYGITQAQCEREGCCYDPTHPNSKWCFYPRDHKCEGIDPNERKDCGQPGIERDECKTKKCCYDDSVPNAPYCYEGNL